MKKPAKDLKKGDKIVVAGKTFTIKEIELSDIGKHGKRKVRIEAINIDDNQKIVIIRPEDYPFETG